LKLFFQDLPIQFHRIGWRIFEEIGPVYVNDYTIASIRTNIFVTSTVGQSPNNMPSAYSVLTSMPMRSLNKSRFATANLKSNPDGSMPKHRIHKPKLFVTNPPPPTQEPRRLRPGWTLEEAEYVGTIPPHQDVTVIPSPNSSFPDRWPQQEIQEWDDNNRHMDG
jgi:hypothetical protein